MNTTAEGNAFRDRVCDLLRTKYPDATTETKVAWKNADITYTQMDHGSRIRVAVECKKYSKKLNTADLNKIVGDYSAALSNQEIHKLIIVSVHGLEAASRQLISTNPLLRFQTFSQLEESLVGLRPYVEDLARQFDGDEVHAYYIEGRFSGCAGTALEALSKWMAEDKGTGFAVLGGYGLGKSSLAKRLASEQAKRYLQDPSERIPILLRLGHVVHETELAGLFGKEFNDQFHLPEFSYRTLLHLNQAGRILIILDGFDEMKHAMTEADFKANFREFNKLRLAGKSKVLLLGRPNALSSESYDLLVKGLGRMADQSYVDTDFPAWREETLDFFTSAESREFLTRYLTYSRNRYSDDTNLAAVETRVGRILADIHVDLMQRPVQARIVGQLAADTNYNFARINLFKLYADFVGKMIDREQEKPARKKIPHHARITFLRDLAWWAWTRDNSAQGVFRKDEVPLGAQDVEANKTAILIDHQHFGVIGATISNCLKKHRNMDRRQLTWQEDRAIAQLWESFKSLGFDPSQGSDLLSDPDTTGVSIAVKSENGDKARSIESHVFENFLSLNARDQFIKKVYPMRIDEFGLVSKTVR
jgi:hypothetical protein